MIHTKRCYNSRIAVLADDYENWETQLKLLWRDRIRSDEPIECFLIYPPPDDRAEQTIGQMMILQRAAAFQRSVLMSVYDSEYDQGRAHSHALVMGDRIDIQSVTTMIQAGEDCPPDQPRNICSLWFGTRQFHPHERAFARHGHAFRFLIHRRSPDAPADPLASDSDDFRQRLRAMIGDAPPSPRIEYMISAPNWIHMLQRTFDSFAVTEREDEGPVAYVAAWYVNCHRQPRCQPHRTVRLRSDISAWQRALMEAWRDRLDMRLRTELYWVDPAPPNPPTQNLIGHVLIVQEPRREHVVVLLSGVAHLGYQDDIHHSAVCIHERQTASSIVDILPVPSHLRSFNFHVGIGPREFLRDDSYRLENGDNIVIAIEVEVPVRADLHPRSEPAETDETNLLQKPPMPRTVCTADDHGFVDPPVSQKGEVLQLATLLPSPVWTVVNCQSIADLRQRLTTFPAPQVCFDLRATKCTQVTIDALQVTPFWTYEYPLAFEFYTDGAFSRACGSAAAGVVLIVHTSQGTRFGGYLTSLCAATASAPRAEASAVILAIHWACYLALTLGFSPTPVSFLYDNIYAGRAAQGRCATTLNSDLTLVARALTLWLEQLSFCRVSWDHVKGHSGHPWNDLADSVASTALKSSSVTTDLSALLQCCLHEGSDQCALSWLWLYEKSVRGDGDAPVLHKHQWKFNAAAPLAHLPDFQAQPFERRRVRHQGTQMSAEQICLRFATANVLTLYPQQDHGGSFLGARAEQLAIQFLSAGLHCIGLQETRCGYSGHQTFESFHVLSSSATARGHGGVQFWIANQINIAHKTLKVSHEHLRIIHGDDRRLIVHLRHPQLALLFLVLHAPCSDDEVELQRWWAQTSNLIPNGYTSWTWAVLCDSNGRLGSVVSNSVGACGAEDENMRGAVFHEWLIQHGLYVPQTFEDAHIGSHATWTHAEGAQGRIDYIALSDNLRSDGVCTWVSEDVDLSLARPDHSCLCADVWMLTDRSVASDQCDVPVTSSHHTITWNSDVHTHASYLQVNLQHYFGHNPKQHLRKKHLTDETCALIQRKKSLFRSLQCAKAAARTVRLQVCFRSWKKCDSKSINLPTLALFVLIVSLLFQQRNIAWHLCVCVTQCAQTIDVSLMTLLNKLAVLLLKAFTVFGMQLSHCFPVLKTSAKATSVALARQLNSKPHISVVSRQVMKLTMPAC